MLPSILAQSIAILAPDLWGLYSRVHHAVNLRPNVCAIPILTLIAQGWATSVTPHSSASDPAEVEALRCLEQGTAKLEEGDVHAAKEFYRRSVEIKRNASSLFNLGVTHYHLSN